MDRSIFVCISEQGLILVSAFCLFIRGGLWSNTLCFCWKNSVSLFVFMLKKFGLFLVFLLENLNI